MWGGKGEGSLRDDSLLLSWRARWVVVPFPELENSRRRLALGHCQPHFRRLDYNLHFPSSTITHAIPSMGDVYSLPIPITTCQNSPHSIKFNSEVPADQEDFRNPTHPRVSHHLPSFHISVCTFDRHPLPSTLYINYKDGCFPSESSTEFRKCSRHSIHLFWFKVRHLSC